MQELKRCYMQKIHSNYPCSQQSLYTVAGLVWAAYDANLAAFTGLKGKYTNAYSIAALVDIKAARDLPTVHSRNSIPESIRIQLLPLGLKCLSNQRKLKSYIHEVFPENAAKPMLAAAGFNSYSSALNEGWEEMNTMVTAGHTFIDANSTVLQAGTTNMPLPFKATYATDKTAFETVYSNYIASTQATPGGTNDKIVANNAVYSTLMAMMEDGRLIFENDSIKKALFTFGTVLSNVTGVGSTGMHITAIDSISKLRIEHFTATVQPGDEAGNAAKDTLDLKMPADTYTVVIMAPGYHDVIVSSVVLTTGVMHRLEVIMVKK